MHTCTHEIFYQALYDTGRALSFPCDSAGRVTLDDLSDRARDNYLYARAVVGRDYAFPVVLPAHDRPGSVVAATH